MPPAARWVGLPQIQHLRDLVTEHFSRLAQFTHSSSLHATADAWEFRPRCTDLAVDESGVDVHPERAAVSSRAASEHDRL